jgi:hypothetical protein
LNFIPLPLNAEEDGAEERGEYLTLKIAVIGPGDELYFWWGHIGLVIEDALTGRSRFYDYGLFSFDNENFFTNFAFGRLLYSCGASPAERNFEIYTLTNRDIMLYTLDLSNAAKEKVRRFAENNVLPENRDYFYHHFKDNCSTRIRDIIDLAVDGQFKTRYGKAPGRYTLRQHVRRHTWHNPLMDWALNFWMGQDIDRPITVWEEMFLPSEVGRRIEKFSYIESAGDLPAADGLPSGRERKLVASVEILNTARGRPPVLDAPRLQWPRELALGLFLAALLVLCIRRENRNGTGRVILGLSQSLLGLFFGCAGTVLVFMSFFTNHDYTYHNFNILFVNPLLLAAIPLGIRFAAGKDKAAGSLSPGSLLKTLWTYVFFGGLFTLIIRILPQFYQQNQVSLAMILPFALSLSFVPSRIRGLFKQ